MDHETKLAALVQQAAEYTAELERLMPQILALGDVEILLPLDIIEEISRPVSSHSTPMPACALRA